MAEIQYQVDEMVFKMNALFGSSNLPEKSLMYGTDSDTTYGGPGACAEDGISCGGSEVGCKSTTSEPGRRECCSKANGLDSLHVCTKSAKLQITEFHLVNLLWLMLMYLSDCCVMYCSDYFSFHFFFFAEVLT